MTTKTKVKNGKVALPKSLGAYWQNAEVSVRGYGSNRIVLERHVPKRRDRALTALKAAAGTLKGKIPNPVLWQRKIRKEWERPLPNLKSRS
ncbi:MAG: hypothetical protein Q8R13_03485 [bacterium]|nr:hypothetical protein [bacterium]MDZ4296451.1 hypothetical protein [Patescibacteria group bacterium]